MTTPRESAIILSSCPDKRGIVAEVSHFVFANNGNILNLDQHKDNADDSHFMRMEWDMNGFEYAHDRVADAFGPIAEKFRMDWQLHFSCNVPRMAIFVSKIDHCLYDLLWRVKSGEIRAEIPLIISNHPDLAPIAEFFGIEFKVMPVTKETKESVEREQIELLESHNIDLVALARYMQILSPTFVEHFDHRIINIHHSFLPAFIGAKPYHQAYERGVKIIGATAHYATKDLDKGPIICQDIEHVTHRDGIKSFIRKGKDVEKNVFARAVKLHLERRIIVHKNRTMVFD